MGVKIVVKAGERIETAFRRFKNLTEKNGIRYDERRCRYFVKASEKRRQKKFMAKFLQRIVTRHEGTAERN